MLSLLQSYWRLNRVLPLGYEECIFGTWIKRIDFPAIWQSGLTNIARFAASPPIVIIPGVCTPLTQEVSPANRISDVGQQRYRVESFYSSLLPAILFIM